MNKFIVTLPTSICMLIGLHSFADSEQGYIANARGNLAITTEPEAPPLLQTKNDDIKQKRDYPMQPPLVPHKTDNYQVDKFANKCLSCHSRRQTQESQAPMISVTHYMDRDGNFLANVSPRRYFCNQCHVTQTNAKILVPNQFVDVDKLLKKSHKENQQ